MSKIYQIVQGVGAVLLLVGAMLQITRWELSPILYTIGAVMFAYVQVMSRYEGKNLIIRRDVCDQAQRMGAMLDCCCYFGTIYGFSYSVGIGKGKMNQLS